MRNSATNPLSSQQQIPHTLHAGLVIDGQTIAYCLQSDMCQQLIYELGIASRSCVCSRLTPLQKRNLVDLVRHRDPSTITLAIGDGEGLASFPSRSHYCPGTANKSK